METTAGEAADLDSLALLDMEIESEEDDDDIEEEDEEVEDEAVDEDEEEATMRCITGMRGRCWTGIVRAGEDEGDDAGETGEETGLEEGEAATAVFDLCVSIGHPREWE